MNPGCSFLDFYRVNFSLAQHRACLTEAKLRSRSEESIAEPLGYRLLLGTTEKNGPESSVTRKEQRIQFEENQFDYKGKWLSFSISVSSEVR